MQLLQEVRTIESEVEESKSSKFILYAMKRIDQSGRCTKRRELQKSRHERTRLHARAEVVSERSGMDMPNYPDEVRIWL